MNEEEIHYDVIGDIHGRHDKLERLLEALGYMKDGTGHTAPAGRKALFLGDLIDPKPPHGMPGGVRNTLRTVKAMCDAGQALCLMGNHEFNALTFHTRGADGMPLRAHDAKNIRMHRGTLDEFPDHADPASEWRAIWLPWLGGLPVHLDLGGLRAIHACWHPEAIQRLRGVDFRNAENLAQAADESTETGIAAKAVLKGIEVPLPEGTILRDNTGTERTKFRARWWEHPNEGITCRQLVFPDNNKVPDAALAGEALYDIQPYPAEAPPVFFGHYLKPGDSPLLPEASNVACLDHRAAKEGPLVAYRWHGEAVLVPEHYVAVE